MAFTTEKYVGVHTTIDHLLDNMIQKGHDQGVIDFNIIEINKKIHIDVKLSERLL